MGEMNLQLLICPLFALRHLSHLHPLIIHFLNPDLRLQSPSSFLIPLLFLLHPLALSASKDRDLTGYLSNGQSLIAISRSGSPSSDDEDDNSDDPIDLINAHSASVTEPSSYRQSQQRPEVRSRVLLPLLAFSSFSFLLFFIRSPTIQSTFMAMLFIALLNL
jgi:hypothetical protein